MKIKEKVLLSSRNYARVRTKLDVSEEELVLCIQEQIYGKKSR